MWWRKRRTTRPSRPAHQDDGAASGDYGAASGRHRLRDNDVVPVAGYRRYADILNARTRELPAVNTSDRPMFTPGQEQRAGIRKWLR
jgi:hypothetical protein